MKNYDDYKEIIYLDTIEMSSALAQLDHGLMESMQKSNTSSQTDKSSTNRNGGLGLGVGIIGKVNAGQSDSNAKTDSEQELINITFSDYQLERLLKGLKDKNVLNKLSNSSDGDYVQIESEFQLYDFEGLARMDSRLYERFMRSTGQSKQGAAKAKNGFQNVQYLGEVLDTLLPDIALISTKDSLSFLEKGNLRINSGQIQIFSGSKRKIKLLGIVESTALTGERIMPDFSKVSLNKIGNYIPAFSDTMLQSAGILNTGDKIIKPIAVYF